MEITDTLDFLLGTWRVARSIEDHRTGIRGRFEGTATMTGWPSGRNQDCGGRALFSEEGELCFGTSIGQAHRNLEYVQRHDATVMVHFADGRPFVDLDLRSGAWQGDHRCGDDRYEIATVARSHGIVEERWRVRGPTKNYDALTTLVRVGGKEASPGTLCGDLHGDLEDPPLTTSGLRR